MKTICFAGGCFWGVEEFFSRIKGVVATKVGYANGHKENPTYEEVCRNNTGHAEACLVEYDPEQISLANLLYRFWSIIDPTLVDQQGPDLSLIHICLTGPTLLLGAPIDVYKRQL